MENREKFREIVEGCIANNRKCQEQLFKLFYGKMLSVCIRYIPDRDSAQEVLQEGFIKVFDKIGAFDHKGSLEGWVRRIVVNTAIDHIRKSKKDPFRTDQDDDFKLGASDPMVEMEELQLLELKAELAMEAIQQLSPAYRTVFSLYVLED